MITLPLAALFGWIAFALNIALVLVARKRVEDYTNNVFNADIGAAVWLSLVGAVSTVSFSLPQSCLPSPTYSRHGSVSEDGKHPLSVIDLPDYWDLRSWTRRMWIILCKAQEQG